MNNDGNFNVFLESLNEVITLFGAHDACHILDADGLNAESFNLLCKLNVAFKVVDGADCVADCA